MPLYRFADILIFLPTDFNRNGVVNYTGRNIKPFHDTVKVRTNKPGTPAASPAGSAIGCSKYARCDITWKVVLGNNPCPCAFNISCCTSGLMLSFWWNWDLLEIPKYRYILDFGGIYNFYNPQNTYRAMAYRIYGSSDRQWFNNIPPKFGAWQHVVILVQSKKMTVYLNGRFNMDKGLTSARNSWFPGATKLIPRFKLKRVDGNYSFGQLLMWGNLETKWNPVFLWRQHYEEIEANDAGYWF